MAIKPKSILDDAPFQTGKKTFALGRSTTGYTLKHNPSYIEGSEIVEADWDIYDPAGGDGAVGAGSPAVIIDGAANDWYRLVGNVGEVLYQ
jgi:hypothetical protein